MGKPTAVILVNYKTPQHTVACARSLYKFCDHDLFDVIIIDNGSGDGSVEEIKKNFPDLIYFEQQNNLGFAEGNNVGLRYSIEKGYQYSLILNNDTLVEEDLINQLKRYLDTHPNTAAVQPAIFWMHRRDKLWNGPGFYNKWLGITYNKNSYDIQSLSISIPVDWLTGCCMLVRNESFRLSGLFNKKFFLYYEDAELSYRLKQFAGQLDYLPNAKLYHEAGVSGKTKTKSTEGFLSPVIHYYVSRNRLWFIRRYGTPVLYPLNLIYNLGYYSCLLVYFKLRRRNEKASMLTRGIKEGLFTPQDQIWVND